MKLAHWMTSLALLTASFDLILSINVGGSVRFCQVMMLGVIVCAFAQMMQVRTILWPRGGYAIALWCIAQGVLITQSPSIGVSVALFASLMIYIAGIAAGAATVWPFGDACTPDEDVPAFIRLDRRCGSTPVRLSGTAPG